MAYLLTILEPRGQRATRSAAEGRELYARMQAFAAGLAARGVLLAAEALTSEVDGCRLSVREGHCQVVDGPFAEAREMIGGIFLVDVASREEAQAIAADCPAAQWAAIEVRRTGTCYE